MHFTSYLQDRQLTVALTGEIDHHCAKEYMQHISEKIESYTPSVCVLDFQEVTFMDSSGIARGDSCPAPDGPLGEGFSCSPLQNSL